MQVTSWTNWNNCNYIELSDSYFPEDEELFKEYYHNARISVIAELRKHGYHFCGGYHQNGKCGVPIIDNKYVFKISLREWGNLMADAYPEEDYTSFKNQKFLKWAYIAYNQTIPEK